LAIGRYEGSTPSATTNSSTKDSQASIENDNTDKGPGFDYRKGPIHVKPTDGWDDSSTYRFGKLIEEHPTDVYRIERLEGFSVMTPFDAV
jgi:hypothetical protein